MIARESVPRRIDAVTFPIGMMEPAIFHPAQPVKRSALQEIIAEKSLEAQLYAQVNIHLPLIRLEGLNWAI